MNLSPFQIADMIEISGKKPVVHHGKYLLVKTLTKSAVYGLCIRTVVGDQNNVGMRMEIQGLKEQFIPKNMYLIIKEPLFTLYQASNALPSITVSSPNDIMFNAD